jgi:hypothetical protein
VLSSTCSRTYNTSVPQLSCVNIVARTLFITFVHDLFDYASQVEEVYNDGLTAAQQLLQQAEQSGDASSSLIPSKKDKKLKPSDDQFKIDYLHHLTLARLVCSAL